MGDKTPSTGNVHASQQEAFMHSKKAIEIAIKAGKIMLVNGAETYRVEETVKRVAEAGGLSSVNVFVIPTGILLSSEIDGIPATVLERISSEGLDLEAIDRVNRFARLYSSGTMTPDEALEELKILENPPKFSKRARFFFTGLAGGFFVLLSGGNFIEFFLAYWIASFTVWIFDRLTLNFFINNIIGGFIASILGLIGVLAVNRLGGSASLNTVIVGPLMTLVPGVALTNGIRDLISGELLAGSARIMEALFIAVALAFGVGLTLQLSLLLN